MKSAEDVIDELGWRDLYEDVERVCEQHRVPVIEVCGRSRLGRIPAVRHLCWWELRDKWGFSFPQLAKLWGVDHTTVMHGVKKAERTLGVVEEASAA